MARPKTNIDWSYVNTLLQAHCDGVGIAGLLGIHPNTFYLACEEAHKISFSEYSAQKKSEGKEILRAKMFEQAMSGDKAMLIWLSKQYLGMKERTDVTTDDNPIIPIIKFVDDNG